MRLAAALLLLLLAGCAAHNAQPPTRPAPTRQAQVPVEIRLTDGKFVQGGFARGRVQPLDARLSIDGAAVPVAPDGGFFVAFGRDAPPRAELRALGMSGGIEVGFSLPIDIAPRVFPEDRLPPINERFEDDPGFAAKRAIEVERIAAARAAASGATGWRQRFILPAEGRISGVFGSQRILGDSPQVPHSGADIAAGEGAPVVAPADGTVVIASPPEFTLEGNLVIIDHGLGLYSALLHLSEVDVHVGDRLKQGDSVGKVGATGRVTGPHLHWGVVWSGVRFDPLTLVP